MTAHTSPTGGAEGDPRSLAERYAETKARVAAAAKRSGRRAEDVLVVAVTKYAEPEDIRQLIGLGHRDFGENRVQQLAQRAGVIQEWAERQRIFPETLREHESARAARGGAEDMFGFPATLNAERPIRWHMIGHLQRNKAKKVAEYCRLIHSVDSLRLAEELQAIANKKDQVIDVLVQVNCSGEESKYGCAVPAALPLAEQIATMVNVRVRGLMTMAPYSENPEDARATFARCRELFTDIRDAGVGEGRFNILSMGMSGDFEVAIEEGANLVRVGTAIFGVRQVADEEEGEEPEPAEVGDAGDELE